LDILFLFDFHFGKLTLMSLPPIEHRSHFGSRYHIWSMRLARPFVVASDPWINPELRRFCAILFLMGLPILTSQTFFCELREEGDESR